jgi:replication fork clamp-binding protein CrfC
MTGEIPRVLDSQELGTREALRKVASPQERNARVAFAAEQDIKQDLHVIRVKWVELAAKLTDFIDNERYLALGFTTIQEWLAQPEINISMQKLYAYTQMYREWIVKRQIDAERLADMSMQSLREITPSVRMGRTPRTSRCTTNARRAVRG